MKYRIGFDLGGTKLKVIILDQHDKIVYENTRPTPLDAEHIYSEMVLAYFKAIKYINNAEHTVGVGIPGNLVRPSYLLDGTDVLSELTYRFHHEVKVENDANCFTLAEATIGAGAGASSVFGVILGTGVGGGFAINGKLFSGFSGMACEWGHTPLITNGKHCWCGNRGCVERYISGKAIEKSYRDNAGTELTAPEVFAKNDVVSLLVKHEFYDNLAQGLANIVNYYDPEIIVIGGGVSNIKDIYDIVPDKVEPLIFNSALRAKIVPALLGNSAGAIGAALL